jgi:hypothetical protein
MKLRLKTAHGFLSFQPDGRLEYRDVAGPWETFELEGFDCPGPVTPPDPKPNPSYHVGPGPRNLARARLVLGATAQEFAHLLGVFPTDEAATTAAREFLRRLIWHYHLAGIPASLQRNPSGAISADKLCLFGLDDAAAGSWQAFDIGSLGYAGHAFVLNWQLIDGAQPIADDGIADAVMGDAAVSYRMPPIPPAETTRVIITPAAADIQYLHIDRGVLAFWAAPFAQVVETYSQDPRTGASIRTLTIAVP